MPQKYSCQLYLFVAICSLGRLNGALNVVLKQHFAYTSILTRYGLMLICVNLLLSIISYVPLTSVRISYKHNILRTSLCNVTKFRIILCIEKLEMP